MLWRSMPDFGHGRIDPASPYAPESGRRALACVCRTGQSRSGSILVGRTPHCALGGSPAACAVAYGRSSGGAGEPNDCGRDPEGSGDVARLLFTRA